MEFHEDQNVSLIHVIYVTKLTDEWVWWWVSYHSRILSVHAMESLKIIYYIYEFEIQNLNNQ